MAGEIEPGADVRLTGPLAGPGTVLVVRVSRDGRVALVESMSDGVRVRTWVSTRFMVAVGGTRL